MVNKKVDGTHKKSLGRIKNDGTHKRGLDAQKSTGRIKCRRTRIFQAGNKQKPKLPVQDERKLKLRVSGGKQVPATKACFVLKQIVLKNDCPFSFLFPILPGTIF